MARVQVGYDPSPEGLQTTASPNIRQVEVGFDPRSSKAFQLAEALNTPLVQQGIQGVNQRIDEAERTKATEFANSRTVSELGQDIKDGKILPSQSPLFAAVVHHTYGENSLAQIERDTISKLQSGELSFSTPQEAEKYLQDQRNEWAQDQNSYSLAGFDKRWNSVKDSILTASTRVANENAVSDGLDVASTKFSTMISQAIQDKLTPTETNAQILDQYKLFRETGVIPRDRKIRKQVLNGIAAELANTGNSELVKGFLDSELGDGVTVRGALGGATATTLEAHTEAKFDQAQRERVDNDLAKFYADIPTGNFDLKGWQGYYEENKKYISAGTYNAVLNAYEAEVARKAKEADRIRLGNISAQSYADAENQVRTAALSGNYAFTKGIEDITVVSPTGETKKYPAKDVATGILQNDPQVQALPFDKQVRMWSVNGLQNPDWDRAIKAGVGNLSSVGWTYDGKNLGELNPQGRAAVDTYLKIAAVDQSAADKYAGSEENQKMFGAIKHLTELGFPDIGQAATIVNRQRLSGLSNSDLELTNKKVKAVVDDVVNPGMFSGTKSWITGIFGNDQVNLSEVQSWIRDRSEVLAQSGLMDAETAVQESVKYLEKVSTKVNNTIYLNKDLPRVPNGERVDEWFGRFIDEVPAKAAAAAFNEKPSELLYGVLGRSQQGMSMGVATPGTPNASEAYHANRKTRLVANKDGGYTAMVGGIPLTDDKGNMVVYSRSFVEEWINTQYLVDRAKAVEDANKKLPKPPKASPNGRFPDAGQLRQRTE